MSTQPHPQEHRSSPTVRSTNAVRVALPARQRLRPRASNHVTKWSADELEKYASLLERYAEFGGIQ